MAGREASQGILGGLIEGDDGLHNSDVVAYELVVAMSAIYGFAGTR
jgi:hypothetical protein